MVPQCEFDLAYGKIEMLAKEQTSTGPTTGQVMFTFNLMTNA